jgi:hypothetical protein
MEAASTSETSVNFYQTTRRNNPEDSHLYAISVDTYNNVTRLLKVFLGLFWLIRGQKSSSRYCTISGQQPATRGGKEKVSDRCCTPFTIILTINTLFLSGSTALTIRKNRPITVCLINSMKPSPSWEPSSRSTGQGIPYLLWDSKIHYRVHKSTLLEPIPSQMRVVYNHTSYFFKIHYPPSASTSFV